MNGTNQRRHYRVGKKEVEIAQQQVMTCDKKKKYMIFGATLLLLSFLEGLVIGMLLGKRR